MAWEAFRCSRGFGLAWKVLPFSSEQYRSSVKVTIGFSFTSRSMALLLQCPSLDKHQLHLQMIETTVLFRTFHTTTHFLYFCQICASWREMDSSFDLLVWFVSCGTLYRPMCAFSKQVQPWNLPQFDSNQSVETSPG